jgi:D-threo-aldose 1-dehydrogenase
MDVRTAWRDAVRSGPLALGGAPLGNLFRAVTDQAAIDVIRRAHDAGVRYFDTAPHYGQGLSERRFGLALHDIPRASYVLSTKVGRLLQADAHAPRVQNGYVDVPQYVQTYDYTRDGVLRSLEDSMQRLGVTFIDIVYVHDIDRATHGDAFTARFREMLNGGLPALASLKAAGTIAAYGIGVNGVDICLQTLRHADLDVLLLAGRYTLADQAAADLLLPLCVQRQVSVVLGGPYNSGILATGAHPADGTPPIFDYAAAPATVVQRVAAIEEVGRVHGVPLKAAALQFPRAHPGIATVLAGARSVAELDENIALARFPIPSAYWVALRQQGLLASNAWLPGEPPT